MSGDSETELLKEPTKEIAPEKTLSPTSCCPLYSNHNPVRPLGSPLCNSHNSTDDSCIESCFLKMERLIQDMRHPDFGVPVRSQKLFLTSIPCAFVGYDVVEWIMDNLDIEDQTGPVAQEALHLANLLCQHGYFFPVGENAKTYTIKDDSTLYRFQAAEYWPSRNNPDNSEYALYLLKRTLKNRPKGSLEEYELEALQRMKKLLANKWEGICQAAEEQIAQSKDKKKPDKVISSSQERAYWRIHRPPPGTVSCLERCPVPSKRGPKRKTVEQLKRQVKILKQNLSRSRAKSTLWQRSDDFREFDGFISTPLPSNPWITDDPTFWIIESQLTDTLTERRLRRWTLSLEELLSDSRGFQEFEMYLRKEYSHENILFWKAVQDLKRGSHGSISNRVNAIFNEYLASGAPCEVNLDSHTMEVTVEAMKKPTRYTFEHAQQHVFTLMQTDIYPRFLRSDHFRNLMVKASLLQIQGHRKRFFNFGTSARKKSSICSTEGRPSTPQGSMANTGLLCGQTPGGVCGSINEVTGGPQQTPPRRLSGSTCDLRESIKRRGSRNKRLASSGSKTDMISDDDSMSVTSQFSGRHSLSTSDLQNLAPANSNPDVFEPEDMLPKKHVEGKTSSSTKRTPLGKRETNSMSDADLDSSPVGGNVLSPATADAHSPAELLSPAEAETDTDDGLHSA